MAKVQVFKRLDGGISVREPGFDEKNPGESDEEFIERTSVKPRAYTHLIGAEEFIMEKEDLPETDTPEGKGNRNKWRINPAGKVFVDHTVELPSEVKRGKLNAAKAKLIAGLPLTEEEAVALTGVE